LRPLKSARYRLLLSQASSLLEPFSALAGGLP